jgi:hypothetical protein
LPLPACQDPAVAVGLLCPVQLGGVHRRGSGGGGTGSSDCPPCRASMTGHLGGSDRRRTLLFQGSVHLSEPDPDVPGRPAEILRLGLAPPRGRPPPSLPDCASASSPSRSVSCSSPICWPVAVCAGSAMLPAAGGLIASPASAIPLQYGPGFVTSSGGWHGATGRREGVGAGAVRAG